MIYFEETSDETTAKHHDLYEGSSVWHVYEDDEYLGYIAIEYGIPDDMLHIHIDHPIPLSTRLLIFRHFKKHYPRDFTWSR